MSAWEIHARMAAVASMALININVNAALAIRAKIAKNVSIFASQSRVQMAAVASRQRTASNAFVEMVSPVTIVVKTLTSVCHRHAETAQRASTE
jgi:hypothetical protein